MQSQLCATCYAIAALFEQRSYVLCCQLTSLGMMCLDGAVLWGALCSRAADNVLCAVWALLVFASSECYRLSGKESGGVVICVAMQLCLHVRLQLYSSCALLSLDQRSICS